MILEELVARLGFDVTGQEKLKNAGKLLDATKKKLSGFAAVVNAGLGISGATAGAGAALGVLGAKAAEAGEKGKRSAVAFVALGTATRALAAVARVAASSVLAVGTSAAVAGAALTVFGARAAAARRELQISAQALGSNAQNLDTLTNLFRGMGFGDKAQEEAKKVVGAVDEILKAIKKGGPEAEEARKKLAGLGFDRDLKPDKNGKLPDSTRVGLNSLLAYERQRNAIAKLRSEADAAEKGGKKRAGDRKRAEANKKEQRLDQLAADLGISGETRVRLDAVLDKRPLAETSREENRLRPVANAEDEAQSKKVADDLDAFKNKLGAAADGVANQFNRLATSVAAGVLPKLNTFADSLINLLKGTGAIPETEEEKAKRVAAKNQEREAQKRETENRKQQVGAIGKKFLELIQWWRGDNKLPARDKDTSPANQGEVTREGNRNLGSGDFFDNVFPPRDKDRTPAPVDTPDDNRRRAAADAPDRLDKLRNEQGIKGFWQGGKSTFIEGIKSFFSREGSGFNNENGAKSSDRVDVPAPKQPEPGPSTAQNEFWMTRLQGFLATQLPALAAAVNPPSEKGTDPKAFGAAAGQSAGPIIAESIRGIATGLSEIVKKGEQFSPQRAAVAIQSEADRKAEQNFDNRKYENFSNDQRSISVSTTVHATGLEGIAAAAQKGVLGAVTTKSANTSTGRMIDP